MVNHSFYTEQYQSLDADARIVADVLSVYLYPLERYTFLDAVNRVREIPQDRILDILELLKEKGLGTYNLAGNYSLIPELGFLLFPENIRKPEYLRLLDHAKPYSFYSTSARLQELQQLLTAFFTGDRSLLLQPVRKISFELAEYFPYLCYLLYYPEYVGLLRLFDTGSITSIYHAAVRQHLLAMSTPDALQQLKVQVAILIRTEPGALAHAEVILQAGETGEEITGTDAIYAQAAVHLYEGQSDKALTAFEQGIKQQRQQDKKHTIPVSPLFAFLYAYTLTILPEEKTYTTINKVVAAYDKKLFQDITPAIALLHFHSGRKEKADHILQILLETTSKQPEKYLLSYLALICLQAYYPKSKLLKQYSPFLKVVLYHGIQRKYRLLTYELLYLFREQAYLNNEKTFRELAAFIGKEPIFSRMQPVADWERLLNVLILPEAGKTQKEKAPAATRLAYLIDIRKSEIQPVIQTQGDTGWSRGRLVELKKLKDGLIEAMTDHDTRIAGAIIKENYHTYGTEAYAFGERVWHEITGHPYLFMLDAPETPVEIIKGQPELVVNKTGNGYEFSTNINDYISDTVLIKESDTRLKVIRLTQQQRTVLQTLRQIETVPATGKDKLMQALRNIGAHMTVHSNLDDTAALNIKQRAGDARIRVQLQPTGDALRASFFVKPFVNDPPYCKPGEGAKHLIGVTNGERCQATRDLDAEKSNLEKLVTLIQESVKQEIEDDVIIFEDPLECLQLLEVIQRHPELATAEWPEGQKLRVRMVEPQAQLRLTIRRVDGKWFAANGDLKVDEDTVLSLKDLLDAVKASNSRFVTVGKGEFLSLTGKLYRQLNELASVAIAEHEELRIRPLAAHMLDELLEGASQVETDEHWKALRAGQAAAATVQAEIPATLQTQLRPYQEEGFRWMARLAAWGAGACLADDMGLGKTIQAIAMLLYRAHEGPALVVCPASVLPNWVNELYKFAPSLQVRQIAGSKRHAILKAAGPFDVVLITYGILQSEDELLSVIPWNTVVLDEAHTIKNYQTKTSKAAMALQAGFRLILTGTPVQNHLTEIWNLFNFINPGLLGSLPYFNKQFTTPVIYNAESTVTKHLRKIVAPFMLRRTKTAVLDELPEKTEIVKMISLSPEEAAFYEALRLKAVENIKRYSKDKTSKHNLNTLTEIGKLRMAACNTQMIDPEIRIPSSKLAVFIEIVKELIDNNHRALVFSQYVKHLDLVRLALDELNVSYCYLDGSTPIPVRERVVKEFQAGAGSLFLISLKAGGTGLNLTAADYVIHLDPWWNPAIEEQASDRAYRIGQTRPVTIYRLVTRHTIEEKIIALHNSKRDLADRLLEGSDISGKLSTDELLSLIAKADK
ncbi:DEAD/DEAH box helicase [Chitinophaga pinensis]|uniref:SNF2-related protein n=1 Tax=Chitinophaga pinensis (strain ATCC 43595 / DSM 2588 / LMG 13176 / NBRC 15968 / NCIMB 11800 / UQM 2034) TaxID=485918 RepID=A0A979FZ55_CHIPD|nr:DEAD/DEAH box helicase [Chitinophaga pinensis]ACU57826.1 SNF2-related protein [Chitinophaga pinensis DSM 2588]